VIQCPRTLWATTGGASPLMKWLLFIVAASMLYSLPVIPVMFRFVRILCVLYLVLPCSSSHAVADKSHALMLMLAAVMACCMEVSEKTTLWFGGFEGKAHRIGSTSCLSNLQTIDQSSVLGLA
jgi:hypothetical protein